MSNGHGHGHSHDHNQNSGRSIDNPPQPGIPPPPTHAIERAARTAKLADALAKGEKP